MQQQTAISEVLRANCELAARLAAVFDAILDSATCLCRADIAAYISPKKATFVARRCEGPPSG